MSDIVALFHQSRANPQALAPRSNKSDQPGIDRAPTFSPSISNLHKEDPHDYADSIELDIFNHHSLGDLIEQPLSQSVTVGQTATFRAYQTGFASFAYQWQKNNMDIPGATSYSNTIPKTTTADNNSAFTVKVSDSRGSITVGGPAVLRVIGGVTQTPFGGAAMAIPGTILVSRYDSGGEGVAYHDTEPANLWTSTYRPGQGVETDGSGIGWAFTGEWLEYTVNVARSGAYTMTIPVSNPGSGGTMHLSFNGANVTGSLAIPSTGSWNAFKTLTRSMNLNAGTQVMRVSFDSNGTTGAVCNLKDIGLYPGTMSAMVVPNTNG